MAPLRDLKVIFVPGNGGGDTREGFFPYLKEKLEERGLTVISPGVYPDPVVASMKHWLPYIASLGADENTILIGHSSGAIAAMRYAEKNQLFGTVLVSAYYTDLDNDLERESGYFNIPWNFEAVRQHQKWIIQFASLEDTLVPVDEARYVAEKLGSEYYELDGKGHFYPLDEFPELVEKLCAKLGL